MPQVFKTIKPRVEIKQVVNQQTGRPWVYVIHNGVIIESKHALDYLVGELEKFGAAPNIIDDCIEFMTSFAENEVNKGDFSTYEMYLCWPIQRLCDFFDDELDRESYKELWVYPNYLTFPCGILNPQVTIFSSS